MHRLGSVLRVEEIPEYGYTFRHGLRGGCPNDVKVDIEVGVDKAIACVYHTPPWNPGAGVARFIADPARGFSQNLEGAQQARRNCGSVSRSFRSRPSTKDAACSAASSMC